MQVSPTLHFPEKMASPARCLPCFAPFLRALRDQDALLLCEASGSFLDQTLVANFAITEEVLDDVERMLDRARIWALVRSTAISKSLRAPSRVAVILPA
ncbi:hypothetical protein D9M72_90280 [compost metagenome]